MGGGREQNQNHPFSLGCPLFHLRFYKASANHLHPDQEMENAIQHFKKERKKEEESQTTQLPFEKSEINQQ